MIGSELTAMCASGINAGRSVVGKRACSPAQLYTPKLLRGGSWNPTQGEGNPMSKSRLSAALSRIGLIVVLMGMTLLPRAYTQPEVDPTWFNPWPAAGKEVPHSMHARPTNRPHRRKVTALAPGQLHTGKRRRNRAFVHRGAASLHPRLS